MKKKITFIGHYAADVDLYDGPTVKTKIICDELKKTDLYDIEIIDTHGWKNNFFQLFKNVRNACRNGDYVIMMPGQVGFRALVRILPFFKRRNNGCKIIYEVIGCHIYEFLKANPKYVKPLNKFDAVIVETNTLKKNLDSIGVDSLYVIPNFKRLDIVKTLAPVAKYPYRFCTFSRVMKEKGIEDAIECINAINAKYGNDIVTLDIYGQVEENYKNEFESLISGCPRYIRYKGVVDFDKSVQILKDYYAMLFPTKYRYECLAGTVVDAFASGLPVIAYNWKYASDLITDGSDGWLCKRGVDNLIKVVEYAISDQDMVLSMRFNCVKKAEYFMSDVNIEKLIKILMEI